MARFNVVAVLRWSVETEGDPAKLATEQLKKILADHKEIRTALKVEGVKKDNTNAIVVGEFNPNDVLPFATWLPEKKVFTAGEREYHVKMNSRRYFVFKTSLKCVACGIEGTKMLLEQSSNSSKTAHFNLYAVENDRLVLMTKDHITPRSCGGGDSHSNYQTMCSICNNLKGSSILTLDSIASLRKLYNENRGILSKKKLRYLLEETRAKLAEPSKKISKKNYASILAADKASQNFVIAKCDINIMQGEQGFLFGYSMHDRFEKAANFEHVASIKKGTVLKTIGYNNSQLIIALDENKYVRIYHGLFDYDRGEGDSPIQPEVTGSQSVVAG